jgi:GAF domain-containing protein
LPARQNGNGVTEYVLKQGQPLLLPIGDAAFRQEHDLAPPSPQLGHCGSEIVVPMFVENRVVGGISALSSEPEVHYSEEHLQVLQAFANQAAVQVRNVLQRIEAEQLRKASEALAGIQGRREVLHAIVEQAHRLIGSDFMGLILQDEDGTLRTVRPTIPNDYLDLFAEPRQQGGVTRSVIETRQPRVIHDTRRDPLVKESVPKAGIRSMLALPLSYGDWVMGVLYAHTFGHRYFGQHDIDLWSAFATQAAAVLWTTMEKEREIEDARRLAEEIGVLADRVNLEETTKRVARAIKVVLRADSCRLAYVDPPTGQITGWTWAQESTEASRYEGEPRPDGTTHHAMRTMQPVFCANAEDTEGPSPPPEMLALGLRSFASLPLVHGMRVIGVAHCSYLTKQQPFNDRMQTLFEALAGRAAVALDGARRGRLDEIWNGLNREIAECTELKELYRLFAEHAMRAMCAEFAVFYPYDPTVPPGKLGLEEEKSVCVGTLLEPWVLPEGGFGGGVHEDIEGSSDGLLIVNNLEEMGGRLQSRLTEREGVRAFVGLRLDVRAHEQAAPQIAGMLFLNYRQPTAFERRDVADLQRAGSLVAASILRLNLRHQRFQQLHAVVEILEAFRQQRYGDAMLERIAMAVKDALSVDTCTVHEYDQQTGEFSWRGAAGLETPEMSWTMHEDHQRWFLKGREHTIIVDAPGDRRLQVGGFVTRERIQSVVVYPLLIEAEPMGLLFVSYRYRKEPTPDELRAIGLFADIAALVLNGARMRDQLGEMRRRLERSVVLSTVSMIENTWRHSMVNRAATIRNWTESLQIRLERCDQQPSLMEGLGEILSKIDRQAKEIADAPPRIPERWELEQELIPLAPFIEEVCQDAKKSAALRAGPSIAVEQEVEGLEDAQLWGYRRWLIYLMEALLQNARRSMPEGGTILISARRAGMWAEVRIQDTGRGVPKEQQDLLFKGQVHKEPGESGMGIGGLLARNIVEEHDGTIELKRPGPGDTTVLVRLPLSEETDA